MPPNSESRTSLQRGAAGNQSTAFAGRTNPDHSGDCRPDQARKRLAQLNVNALWRAHQRAIEFDLAEKSPASRILRFLAFAAWREAFLADGAL